MQKFVQKRLLLLMAVVWLLVGLLAVPGFAQGTTTMITTTGVVFVRAVSGLISSGALRIRSDIASLTFGAADDTALTRGGAAGKLALTGTTPMLQFGGTTNSFPGLKQNGTTPNSFAMRLADDSANTGVTMLGIGVGASNNIPATGFVEYSGGLRDGNTGNLLDSRTAPTISSGFGTSPTVPANNGTAIFTVNVGTGGTAFSGVVLMPAAATGWGCEVNMEGVVPTTLTKQTANTTTTVTVTNYTVSTGATAAWAASTILTLKCAAR